MELAISRAKLAELVNGAKALLSKDDLDVLFAMRVSGLVTVCEPELKTYNRVREKLEKEYLTVPIQADDGQTIGHRAPDDQRHEYTEKRHKMDDHEVKIDVVPSIKLSELRKMSEEEGIPISGSILLALRPVIVDDVGEGAEASDSGGKQTRAQRRKKSRDETKAKATKKGGKK